MLWAAPYARLGEFTIDRICRCHNIRGRFFLIGALQQPNRPLFFKANASHVFLLKKPLILFLLLLFVPLAASAVRYLCLGDGRGNWQTADRSSAGLLPLASSHPDALNRVFAARTVRWRSIFAVHTWIVLKERDATSYSRYDYTAWGEPIRTNGFAPDGRWFGANGSGH
jgi:hypothetical protein